jgi:hypothetical protein
MRTRKFAAYCLVALLAGCVPIPMPIFSVHPLYTKETITFEEKLLGTWLMDPNEPEDTLEFTRLEASAASRLPFDLEDQAAKCYRVNRTDRNDKASVIACLVKLQNRLFLDLMPGTFPGGEQNPESADFQLNAMFFLRLHTFMRVDFTGNQLKIGLTLDDGFKKLLKAEPKAVTYTMVKENPILIKKGDTVEEHPLLTASTPELQAFVTKYADDERLFIDGEPLTRKPSNTAK